MPASRSRRHRVPRPRAHARRRRDAGRGPRPHAVRHQQRLARRLPRSPSTCVRWASPPSPTTSSPARKAPRVCWRTSCLRERAVLIVGTDVAGRRGHAMSACKPGSAVVRRAGRRGAGAFTADRLARPRRGGAGDPRRRTVGRRQRRQTLPSERGLLPETARWSPRCATATDREPQVAGKPAADAARRMRLARGDFRNSAGGRRPARHRHRRRQCRRPAQPAGAHRRQHRRGHGARHAASERPNYIAADLRSLYARADTTPGRAASGVARRGRPGRGDRARRPASDPRDPLTVVRATASAVWNSSLDGHAVRRSSRATTPRAQALERWSLLTSPDRLA